MSHLHSITLVLAVGLLVGCASDPQPDFPVEPIDEEAIIEAETLEVFFDEEDMIESTVESTSDLTVRTQGLVGDPSQLIPSIRGGLRASNQMLRPGIELLNTITASVTPILRPEFAYYEFTDNGAVTTLIVQRDPDFGRPGFKNGRQYNYNLTVRAVGQPLALGRPLLAGYFRPGPRDGAGRQTGEGLLRYDYTAIAEVDPDTTARGVGAVAFRVGPLRRQLTLLFVSFQLSPDSDVLNAQYNYDLGRDGSGAFSFRSRSDLIAESPGLETYRQSSVWTPDKAGRGRVAVRFDAFPGTEINLSECWDPSGGRVWSLWDPLPDDQTNDGDEQSCPRPFIGLDLPLPDEEEVLLTTDPEVPTDG